MQALGQIAFACLLVATGAAMAFYEWGRLKAGRPLLSGHGALDLYWMSYLSCFVLGLAFFVAALAH